MMWAYLLVVLGVVSLLVTLVVRTTAVASRQPAATTNRPLVTALTGVYLVALVVLIGGVCSFLWLGSGWHMGC
ncbi:hypothetical protein [Levilactobacillus zymae]|uniref:Uncharacterized protein n=2 Tax=Levilactobacillus zymae TaxID=267363 RepID=A0A1Y6JZE5_9LACO|nr:hypothetical protein [Levilactobacillus zymae]QFR62145.1 hypothetical protein LZ395_11640 [Levilactobacillus zymae]SMS15265.1 hypothetical protein LZ3411_2215 [Levilactobacillus zymae]